MFLDSLRVRIFPLHCEPFVACVFLHITTVCQEFKAGLSAIESERTRSVEVLRRLCALRKDRGTPYSSELGWQIVNAGPANALFEHLVRFGTVLRRSLY